MAVVKAILLVAAFALASGAAGVGAVVLSWASDLPDLSPLDNLQFTSTSRVLARDGSPIGFITAGEQNRIPVPLDDISPAALAAIVVKEDASFFRHYGLDPLGILRGIYITLTSPRTEGGSSITQQVVKQMLLSDIATERSIERKIKEFVLAIELERRFTKEEILQRYVNVVFWGGNSYGIQSASEAYFSKPPLKLSLAEGAYLAAMLSSPNNRYLNLRQTREIMRQIFSQMVDEGWITRSDADRAWLEEIVPNGWEAFYDDGGNLVESRLVDPRRTIVGDLSINLAPHVAFEVRKVLTRELGAQRLFGAGGLTIYTTIDIVAQEIAERVARDASLPPDTEIAIVAVEPATGEILAMVGERPKATQALGEFNRALQAMRSPGSAFKPILYATALEEGFTQAQTLLDEDVTFPDPTQPDGVWRPRNFDRQTHGLVTLRLALNQSYNIPAIKLMNLVSPAAVVDRSRQLGFGANFQPTLSLALGAYGSTPTQMTGAFAAFANDGVWVEPHLIKRVEDASGQVVWEPTVHQRRVFDTRTAYLIIDMMKGVVNEGIAPLARMPGREVAGKTGTSQNNADLWFVGFTPEVATGVWVGKDDNTRILDSEGNEPSSSIVPPPIWRAFMEAYLRGRPPRTFARPPGIVTRRIDLVTGLLDPQNGREAAFLSGTEPTRVVDPPRPFLVSIPFDIETLTYATESTPAENIEFRLVSPLDLARYTPPPPMAGVQPRTTPGVGPQPLGPDEDDDEDLVFDLEPGGGGGGGGGEGPP
jgi:membrane peptidoglycan carboxypeptidase